MVNPCVVSYLTGEQSHANMAKLEDAIVKLTERLDKTERELGKTTKKLISMGITEW